jgi:hypothetical protein
LQVIHVTSLGTSSDFIEPANRRGLEARLRWIVGGIDNFHFDLNGI